MKVYSWNEGVADGRTLSAKVEPGRPQSDMVGQSNMVRPGRPELTMGAHSSTWSDTVDPGPISSDIGGHGRTQSHMVGHSRIWSSMGRSPL